jgi:hypothetical protein
MLCGCPEGEPCSCPHSRSDTLRHMGLPVPSPEYRSRSEIAFRPGGLQRSKVAVPYVPGRNGSHVTCIGSGPRRYISPPLRPFRNPPEGLAVPYVPGAWVGALPPKLNAPWQRQAAIGAPHPGVVVPSGHGSSPSLMQPECPCLPPFGCRHPPGCCPEVRADPADMDSVLVAPLLLHGNPPPVGRCVVEVGFAAQYLVKNPQACSTDSLPCPKARVGWINLCTARGFTDFMNRQSCAVVRRFVDLDIGYRVDANTSNGQLIGADGSYVDPRWPDLPRSRWDSPTQRELRPGEEGKISMVDFPQRQLPELINDRNGTLGERGAEWWIINQTKKTWFTTHIVTQCTGNDCKPTCEPNRWYSLGTIEWFVDELIIVRDPLGLCRQRRNIRCFPNEGTPVVDQPRHKKKRWTAAGDYDITAEVRIENVTIDTRCTELHLSCDQPTCRATFSSIDNTLTVEEHGRQIRDRLRRLDEDLRELREHLEGLGERFHL